MARTRSRRVEMQEAEVPAEIIGKIREVFAENIKMNEHKRAHDKARKELYAGMKDVKLKRVEVPSAEGTILEAEIFVPEKMVIDMKKLKTLVTEDQWQELITTTKGAIECVAGKNVANMVISSVPDPEKENVRVKVKK